MREEIRVQWTVHISEGRVRVQWTLDIISEGRVSESSGLLILSVKEGFQSPVVF